MINEWPPMPLLWHLNLAREIDRLRQMSDKEYEQYKKERVLR